jgi:hypothetical protein
MITVVYLIFILFNIHFMNYFNVIFFKQFFANLFFFLVIFLCEYIYFQNFELHLLFLNFFLMILIFFCYAALQKSISLKMVLDIHAHNFSFNNYYLIFKKDSFDNRVNNLIDDNFFKKNQGKIELTEKGIFYRKIFIILQKIYNINDSG